MIKPFQMDDLGYFLPNKFSDPDTRLDFLTDPEFKVQSLWHEGMVAAILCFRNYWGNCWLGFFLIAETFPRRLASVLRDHIRKTMIEYNASRLQTESVACPELDRWHEFLGFKWEGCREKMIYDRDYNMWCIMRGDSQ